MARRTTAKPGRRNAATHRRRRHFPNGPVYYGPEGVASNCEAWWDVGSAGATPNASTHYFTTANDALQNQQIVTITDRSGHGRDLGKISGNNFGIWSDAGFNSLGEIAWGGAHGCTAAWLATIPEPYTVFWAGALDTDGTPASEYMFASGGGNDKVAARNDGTSIYMFNTNNTSAGTVVDLEHALFHFEFGAGHTMRMYKNGTALIAQDTTNSVGNSLSGNFVLGAQYNDTLPLSTECRTSEVVVYSTVPTGAQLTSIKTYFANKYGLTIA